MKLDSSTSIMGVCFFWYQFLTGSRNLMSQLRPMILKQRWVFLTLSWGLTPSCSHGRGTNRCPSLQAAMEVPFYFPGLSAGLRILFTTGPCSVMISTLSLGYRLCCFPHYSLSKASLLLSPRVNHSSSHEHVKKIYLSPFGNIMP